MFSFSNVSNKASGRIESFVLWDFLLCHFHFWVFDASKFPLLRAFLMLIWNKTFRFHWGRRGASKWTEPFSSWTWACVHSNNRENVEHRSGNRWSEFSYFCTQFFSCCLTFVRYHDFLPFTKAMHRRNLSNFETSSSIAMAAAAHEMFYDFLRLKENLNTSLGRCWFWIE